MVHRPQSTEARTVEELLARSSVYHALSVLLRHPTTWQQAAGRIAARSGSASPIHARWWDHPDANTAKWLVAREHHPTTCHAARSAAPRRRRGRLRRSDRWWDHRLPEVLGRLGADGRLSGRARRMLKMLDTAVLLDLTRQHELTFGHAVQGTAPPYELEYGEEHSHRQPQELGDIAAFYTAFGLRIAPSAHERVDYVGTECEFLHYLLYKRACALDEDADEQAQVCEEAGRRFLADHLGRWGPAFALRLTRVAGDGWLGIMGELLLEWLSQECTRMNVPLGSCDLPLRSPKEQDEVGCAACLPAQVACGGQAGVLQQGKPGDGPTTCR